MARRQKIIRDADELAGLGWPVMVLDDAVRGLSIADIIRAVDSGFVTIYNASGKLFASRPAFELARDALHNGVDPADLEEGAIDTYIGSGADHE